ncbi:hypothetical protein EWB00_007795 [Schistosoma japonicum]|uniref:Uncharacterized protein n=1 Tax=Schistosoma japonicum TaxID=6182 RepID=A0A4Z2CTG5_SCHJA|nr:hypothetical protein EWB00_007795 [Schistosoma japonicum]
MLIGVDENIDYDFDDDSNDANVPILDFCYDYIYEAVDHGFNDYDIDDDEFCDNIVVLNSLLVVVVAAVIIVVIVLIFT